MTTGTGTDKVTATVTRKKSSVTAPKPETVKKANSENDKVVTSETKKKSFVLLNNLVCSVLKKVVLIAVVYAVYYFDLSFLWLIGLVILLGLHEEKKKIARDKIQLKRAAALVDEKDAVLRRFEELPAWIMFPDVDRAEWLNKIIKQLWPNVNKYVVKQLRTTVQNKIKKKFESFKFDEVDIGYVSPRIDGVKVYDNKAAKNEIIIDFDVFYDGDCDINFSLYGTKGNMNGFQLAAELRMVMKPIIAKLPLVGGLQLFFLNSPDLDFELEGIASVPGFKHFLKRRILKIMSAKIVFPNKIPIKLSKSLDAAELKSVEPEGVLRVHVLEAKNLEKKDVNVLGIGKSDPYAVISVGAQEYKTKIVDNTVDPKWDFWCEFCILDPTVQHLDIEVLDHDLKSDDFLGSVVIDINEIVEGGKMDQWLHLEKVKHGKIHLRFTWLALSTDYSHLESAIIQTKLLKVSTMSTALLTVYIDSARNIPQTKVYRKPDPYVALTVGSKTQETKTKKHTTEASWQQGFMFLVADPNSDSLYITLIDHKSDYILDQHNYLLHNLIGKPELEISKEECKLNNGTIVIISLELRILKHDDGEEYDDELLSDDELSRHGSTRSTKSSHSASTDKNDIDDTAISDSLIEQTAQNSNVLIHRSPSTVSTAGDYGLGRMQLTLRYSEPRQKFIVTVHKIANLPLKDPSNIPDPYVKLLLLPGGAHNKQKTKVIMDNCNPVYNQTFEYLLPEQEIHKQTLILTVKSKIKFSLHNKMMGQVIINLDDMNFAQSYTTWFDLGPESKE